MVLQRLKVWLFRIVPHQWIYSAKKHLTINFGFFGKAEKNIGSYLVQASTAKFSVHGMESELGKEVVQGFRGCYDEYKMRGGLLREFILQCENCIIEPKFGWGIDEATDKLIFDSIAYNSWRESYHPSYLRYKKGKESAAYYPAIVSIRIIRGGEKNYWHFLHDLLGQVVLARKNNLGIETGIPYLISESLAAQPFFKKAVLQSRYLSGINWIVQRNNEYIKAGTAYFLQVQPNKAETFFAVRSLFDFPKPDGSKNRKIFLTRNPRRIRHLQNAPQIESIAKNYGFEIVDADNLSFEEQMRLFSETNLLVGIHGAGLINMIFRSGASMHLLELLPKDYVQPHYFWLSKDLGFSYRCLIGSKAASDTSFTVSSEEFEIQLQSLLTTSQPFGHKVHPEANFQNPIR
jgi:hypothetical protein